MDSCLPGCSLAAVRVAAASLRQPGIDRTVSTLIWAMSTPTKSGRMRSRFSIVGRMIGAARLVNQILSQARSNGRGVTGLRRVLRSLELGEVQTLLVGENFQAHAVECTGCGHIDAHLVSFCPVCGRATQEIVDVGEAILPLVMRRDIETFYVKDDPEFDKVGNIAALLRFRSEKVQPISTVRRRRSGKSRSTISRTAAAVCSTVETIGLFDSSGCSAREQPLSQRYTKLRAPELDQLLVISFRLPVFLCVPCG